MNDSVHAIPFDQISGIELDTWNTVNCIIAQPIFLDLEWTFFINFMYHIPMLRMAMHEDISYTERPRHVSKTIMDQYCGSLMI